MISNFNYYSTDISASILQDSLIGATHRYAPLKTFRKTNFYVWASSKLKSILFNKKAAHKNIKNQGLLIIIMFFLVYVHNAKLNQSYVLRLILTVSNLTGDNRSICWLFVCYSSLHQYRHSQYLFLSTFNYFPGFPSINYCDVLQSAVNSFVNWCTVVGLNLNTEKWKVILFSRSRVLVEKWLTVRTCL